MSWRDLGHSLFQRQQAIGTQRQTATQWWDRPLSVWPVGVHDFPDKQRPLYGGRGNSGGVGLTTPSVLLGTLVGQGADLAVQMVSVRVIAPGNVTQQNPHAFFPAFVHIWTPQQTPDPVAIAPPTFPSLNRGFLRPRPRISDSGRGVILSGQESGGVQAQAQASPRWACESTLGDFAIFGTDVWAAPFPRNKDIYFDPPLIVPAEQFLGVTTLGETSVQGGSLQLDVQFVWREVSP